MVARAGSDDEENEEETMSTAYITVDVDDAKGSVEMVVSGREDSAAFAVAVSVLDTITVLQGDNFVGKTDPTWQ